MVRTNDPLGDFMKDFAIALALSYIPAQIWGSSVSGGFHPVTGLVAMASMVLVQGWLVIATWHGRISLAVLILVLFLVARYVRPVGWLRCLAFLATFIAWGAHITIAPEALGDGLQH